MKLTSNECLNPPPPFMTFWICPWGWAEWVMDWSSAGLTEWRVPVGASQDELYFMDSKVSNKMQCGILEYFCIHGFLFVLLKCSPIGFYWCSVMVKGCSTLQIPRCMRHTNFSYPPTSKLVWKKCQQTSTLLLWVLALKKNPFLPLKPFVQLEMSKILYDS